MRVPDAPPELLSGRPAIYWARRSVIAIVAAVPTVLLMPVAALLPVEPRTVALGCLLLAALAVAGVMLHAGIQWGLAEIRERDAGYTTQYGKRFDLWQLDPKTGEVLRRPGERVAENRG